MPEKQPHIYTRSSTAKTAKFLDNVASAKAEGASNATLATNMVNKEFDAPNELGAILDAVPQKDGVRMLDAVERGIAYYTAQHGTAPSADLVDAALQQGHSALFGDDGKGNILDSVPGTGSNSAASASTSLQPDRAVVAVVSALAEGIPVAGYLPVDIKSNQGTLAIVNHIAGSSYGDYAEGDLLDGVNGGDVYASSSRFAKIDVTGAGPFIGKFTGTNLGGGEVGFCDPAGTAVPVLRGRTIIYVAGIPAGMDNENAGSSSTALSGYVKIKGVEHTIAGTVAPDTGIVTITTISPALPADVAVYAQGFINYEKAPALIPSVMVSAQTYKLFANSWRVMTSATIDSSTQMRNELGIDVHQQALMAIRVQNAQERHYQAIRMMNALAENQKHDFDLDYTNRSQQMTRSQMWPDFRAAMGVVDQQMANVTMDHGTTHWYAGEALCAQFASMGEEHFQPSGVAARAGVYRVGRVFDKYELYYTPKHVFQAADGSEADLLCVGRSSNVARNVIILGDAVAPMFLDLNMNSDLKRSAALYARDFTTVNPHAPSAMGCAKVRIKGLKKA